MGIQVKYTMKAYTSRHTGQVEPESHAYLARHEGSDLATYITEPFTFNTGQEAEAALLEYCSRDTWNSPTLEEILLQTKKRGDNIEFIEV